MILAGFPRLRQTLRTLGFAFVRPFARHGLDSGGVDADELVVLAIVLLSSTVQLASARDKACGQLVSAHLTFLEC